MLNNNRFCSDKCRGYPKFGKPLKLVVNNHFSSDKFWGYPKFGKHLELDVNNHSVSSDKFWGYPKFGKNLKLDVNNHFSSDKLWGYPKFGKPHKLVVNNQFSSDPFLHCILVIWIAHKDNKTVDFDGIVIFEMMNPLNLTETKFSSYETPNFTRIGKISQCVVVILHWISLKCNATN